MKERAGQFFNALIRTHHITSRKKVAKLKKAAHAEGVSVIIRSGGSPGIMYVQGNEESVKSWIGAVAALRYKDYQLVRRPAMLDISEAQREPSKDAPRGELLEEDSVHAFATEMDKRGVLHWWRKAMGYVD